VYCKDPLMPSVHGFVKACASDDFEDYESAYATELPVRATSPTQR
jgi:hypothetical protein